MERTLIPLSEEELKVQIDENSKAIDLLLKELGDSVIMLTTKRKNILL